MAEALMAGSLGLLAGSSLLIGALLGWFIRVPQTLVAAIMAFGAGVLISALAYELVEEANNRGGVIATAGGFLVGATLFVGADYLIARSGGRHRKRSSGLQKREEESSGSGLAIAAGALLDGVPESIVLGLSVAGGGQFSVAILAAVAISNVPEGLSSSAGMKSAGRSSRYVFGVWGGIALASGVAALVGNILFASASGATVAFVTAVAAGAILAMICNTMIPEAFTKDRSITGLIAALGFLAAFILHQLG